MNLFDMTRDDWILFSIVIAMLAIPAMIRPISLWLGKKLGFVQADAVDSSVTAFQDMSAEGTEKSAAAPGEGEHSAPEVKCNSTAEDGEVPPSAPGGNGNGKTV